MKLHRIHFLWLFLALSCNGVSPRGKPAHDVAIAPRVPPLGVGGTGQPSTRARGGLIGQSSNPVVREPRHIRSSIARRHGKRY